MARIFRCPKCSNPKVLAISRGRYRCGSGHEWRPDRLPLRLTSREWKKLLRGFVLGRTSEEIAEKTRIHRQQALRALMYVRQTIQKDAPAFYRKAGSQNILSVRKKEPKLGLMVPKGEIRFGEHNCFGNERFNTATLRAIARRLNSMYDYEDSRFERSLKTNIPRTQLLKQLEVFTNDEIDYALREISPDLIGDKEQSKRNSNYRSDLSERNADISEQLFLQGLAVLPGLRPKSKMCYIMLYHRGKAWFQIFSEMNESIAEEANIVIGMWNRYHGIVHKSQTQCLAPPEDEPNPNDFKPPKILDHIFIDRYYYNSKFYHFWRHMLNKWKFDKRGIRMDQVPLYLAEFCWLFNHRNLTRERMVRKLTRMLKMSLIPEDKGNEATDEPGLTKNGDSQILQGR